MSWASQPLSSDFFGSSVFLMADQKEKKKYIFNGVRCNFWGPDFKYLYIKK